MHGASGERDEGGREERRRALATGAGLLQVVSRRQDEDALDFLAEVGPKVAQVAGNEMSLLLRLRQEGWERLCQATTPRWEALLGARRINVCFWTAAPTDSAELRG